MSRSHRWNDSDTFTSSMLAPIRPSTVAGLGVRAVRSTHRKLARFGPSGVGSRRLAWVDAARGIAIILVVLLHAWGGAEVAGLLRGGTISTFSHDVGYAFHMPLFFFVSGMFLEQSRHHDFVLGKLRTLVYPYVLWSLLQGTLIVAFADVVNHPLDVHAVLWGICGTPPHQFWFLQALIAIVFLLAAARWLGLGRRSIFVAALLLYFLALPVAVNVRLGGFGRTLCQDTVYVAAGLLLGDAVRARVPSTSPREALIASTVSFLMLVTSVWYGLAAWPSAGPALAALGIVATFGLAAICPRPALVRLGQASLAIYVGHVIAVAAGRAIIQRLGVAATFFSAVVFPTTLGLLGPWVLYEAALRWRIPLFRLEPRLVSGE